MTKTRAELRELIRQELGDEVRISGTATGGSKTTLVDTAAQLRQMITGTAGGFTSPRQQTGWLHRRSP